MTTQANPPTEAQQLHDARTANALLRERLQEQERIAASERARADAAEHALTETYAHWREARNAELLLVRNDLEETRRANRHLLEDQYNLLVRLHAVERECAATLTRADAAERQCAERGTPPTITPLWDETRCRVCRWPVKERIEDGCTRESCSQRPLPSPRADAGYVPADVQDLLPTDTEERALISEARAERYARLRAAAGQVEAVGYTADLVTVSRAAFERLKGAIDEQ